MTVAYQAPIVPHLALPLTLDHSGAFGIVVQDTVEEVAQSVEVLLGTQVGERVMCPSYGVADPSFSVPVPGPIVQATSQWEPHAALSVAVSTPPSGRAQINVQVDLATPNS